MAKNLRIIILFILYSFFNSPKGLIENKPFTLSKIIYDANIKLHTIYFGFESDHIHLYTKFSYIKV